MQITRGLPLSLAFVGLLSGCAAAVQQPAQTTPAGSSPSAVLNAEPGVIPVGQQMDVRLQQQLSSATARVEDRFEATTVVDLMQGNRVLVPAGSTVRGIVTTVEPAGKIDRTGRLALSFDQLRANGRTYSIRAMPTQAFESRGVLEEGRTVGAGGALGAIVGGILGGIEGAIIGAAVGAGGVIAATEGADVVLPAGTIFRIRMDRPVEVG
jgi:hypothetical protein